MIVSFLYKTDNDNMPVRKYLTHDETKRLLVTDLGSTDNLFIQIGVMTGCRVSEITNLLIRNIMGQFIKIWDEKKDEYRLVVIDTATMGDIYAYLELDYKPLRGVKVKDRKLFNFSNRTANRKIKKAFCKIEIPEDVPYRWHTLRHTFVRLSLDRMGARGIQFVCAQTGDSAQTILAIYGIPSLDSRCKEIESFGKGFWDAN